MFNLMPFSTNEPDVFDYFDAFNRFLSHPSTTTSYMQCKTDVAETKDSFLLAAELPGFSKEDISIELKDDVLTITASHKKETEEKEPEQAEEQDTKPSITYLRKERQEVSYKRSFHIENIDSANIKANYNNGILELTLPKQMPKEPERIKIDVA